MKKPLGTIISGSLHEGFIMKLLNESSSESLKAGKFVCIAGKEYVYFALVTNIMLNVTHPDILLFPPTPHDFLLKKILERRDTYTTAHLKPMLMMNPEYEIMPVKTIPLHFSFVYDSNIEDIQHIFGDQKDATQKYFHVGSPIDMAVPLCIDLEKLTERSNGIFGKTGTGKTFITRLILAGLIKHEKAVNLIFDMHSEYGLQARKEGSNTFVKGLKTLFPNKVVICSIDPVSTRKRGASPDIELIIPAQAIRVEDVLSLQDELNLHETALEAAYLIAGSYQSNWLTVLLASGKHLKDLAQELGVHPESLSALYRKLKRLEQFSFIDLNNHQHNVSAIDAMMKYLEQGISVIIEFGTYNSSLAYLLIANIITRRIHQEYTARTEKFLSSGATHEEPKKLLITIEEAHKFLNPQAAKQTIFGMIAREMRKYYVSLLVVDQRPSGIDTEILSQIGTKFVAQLSDEKDINAVLVGMQNAQHLRTILASLDSKKQALIMGHALPMPMVVKTREYDDEFYKSMAISFTVDDINQILKELSN